QSLKEPERNLIKRADLMLNGSIAFIVRKRSLGPQ
ncbi:MAG: TetR family transcriptional regulator, partial [Lacticaseibacillus paracasei]|nr:TetR family transcriptional regulator [Lacticaseibacillus paracasei]